MAPRRLSAGHIGPPRPVPPTAHRLAAWLSLAKSLLVAPVARIRFPPSPEDADALQRLWRERLGQLRDAGLEALRGGRAFRRALDCRPHAFAYAGEGRPCKLPFCPFCNAREAADVYERALRALRRRPGQVGLLLGQVSLLVRTQALARGPFRLLARAGSWQLDDFFAPLAVEGGMLGSIVRLAAWPHEKREDRAVLSARVLAAVPHELARTTEDGRRAFQRAWRLSKRGLSYEEAGLNPNSPPVWVKGYVVRPSSVSLARAAAHLCRYPGPLLTDAPEGVAGVLNRLAGHRLSAVRGVFRDALSVTPASYQPQYVPTVCGPGVASAAASLLPGEADEAAAAREFARTLGLPQANSFAALSRLSGLRLYWLGRVGFEVRDLFRPRRDSELWQAVARGRPPRPGRPHALVGLYPGIGTVLFFTAPEERRLLGVPGGPSLTLGVRLRNFVYDTGPVAECGRWALEAMRRSVEHQPAEGGR